MSSETKDDKPVVMLCIGMAGSGKSTLMMRLNSHLNTIGGKPYVVNLDPAVTSLPFKPNIDIRDTINYKQVMKDYTLGPNGAILTSLNLFTAKFDKVLDILEQRKGDLTNVIVDTPGQIEVFTWSASGTIITETLASLYPTVILYVIDTPRTCSPVTFMSNMLYACSILYKTKLPFILAFNKIDVVSHEFAVDWMTDFEAFQVALQEEESSYMNSLVQSMSLMLEEFYKHLNVVGVSSMTGEGMDDLFIAVENAVEEYYKDYLPEIEKIKKEREDREDLKKKESLEKLMKDLKVDEADNTIDKVSFTIFDNLKNTDGYLFDLIFFEQETKNLRKYTLHPSLNNQVYNGQLKPCRNGLVTIDKFVVKKKSIKPGLIVDIHIIMNISLNYNEIEVCPEISQSYDFEMVTPWCARRYNYLDMEQDDIPCNFDYRWFIPLHEAENVSPQVSIEGLYSYGNNSTPDLPVVGRVVSKSRITYYGKPDEINLCPYRFSFIVSDGTEIAQVTVWQTSVLRYFNAIHINDCVKIEKYKRRSINASIDIGPYDPHLDLMINPSNPKGRIELVKDDLDSIPKRHLKIVNKQSMANDQLSDLVGIVTYMSDVFVERKSNNGIIRTSKYVYLTVADAQNISFNLKLYRPEENLLGSLVCFYDLKCHVLDNEVEKFSYFSSCALTQCHVLYQQEQILDSPFFEQFALVIENSVIFRITFRMIGGGYFDWPVLKLPPEIEFSTDELLNQEVGSLILNERKRLYFHGNIYELTLPLYNNDVKKYSCYDLFGIGYNHDIPSEHLKLTLPSSIRHLNTLLFGKIDIVPLNKEKAITAYLTGNSFDEISGGPQNWILKHISRIFDVKSSSENVLATETIASKICQLRHEDVLLFIIDIIKYENFTLPLLVKVLSCE
ncbi:ATP binding domain-containing protein [Rozella allomycis CSF55]|uniref:GPN-loop GTPase 1 n=2 Tax=Rozella allomycis (strain CSF55) TaxID=988480 RepID=A0A075AYE3_ROZAC|nr:ATP binding domain-containing protein [Rozella allomycis CSF55]|eukprot:EPZ35114.1 ATP binding domain-containing protein [Rozella allomycis CSF55]